MGRLVFLMVERFCLFVRLEKSLSVMFRVKLDDDGEEEVEEELIYLNMSMCSLYLVVLIDKFIVKYMGDGWYGNDVGVI